MDCIFCKIAAGEIPAYKLWEDDEFIAIFDRFPCAEGHTLVIPKVHADDIFALDPDTAGRAFALAGRLAKRVQSAFQCDGINILQNNGEASGQSVRHFHVHIVPRHTGDHAGISIKWKPTEPTDEEMSAALARIGSAE